MAGWLAWRAATLTRVAQQRSPLTPIDVPEAKVVGLFAPVVTGLLLLCVASPLTPTPYGVVAPQSASSLGAASLAEPLWRSSFSSFSGWLAWGAATLTRVAQQRSPH